MLRENVPHELRRDRPLTHRQADHAFHEHAVGVVGRDLLELSRLLESLHQEVGVEQRDGELAPRLEVLRGGLHLLAKLVELRRDLRGELGARLVRGGGVDRRAGARRHLRRLRHRGHGSAAGHFVPGLRALGGPVDEASDDGAGADTEEESDQARAATGRGWDELGAEAPSLRGAWPRASGASGVGVGGAGPAVSGGLAPAPQPEPESRGEPYGDDDQTRNPDIHDGFESSCAGRAAEASGAGRCGRRRRKIISAPAANATIGITQTIQLKPSALGSRRMNSP